jgi:ABC-type spermidine/putrescine transport systems, ATPase components
VGIRPERIVAVAGASAGTANSADAEVVTKMYLGDQMQIVAKLPGIGNVVVREQRASADPALDTFTRATGSLSAGTKLPAASG